MFKMKCTWKVIAGSLLGLLIGGISAYVYQAKEYRFAAFAMTDYELSEIQRESVEAFSKSSDEVSIFSQKQLIKYVEYRNKMGWLDDRIVYQTRGMARARIAVTLYETGKTNEAEKLFQDALLDLEKAKTVMNRNDYNDLINDLRKSRGKI